MTEISSSPNSKISETARPREPREARPIVRVDGLRHEIAGRVILDLPDWVVAAGRHCLVIGPSGSGKTTLLHLIAGLLTPTAGRLSVAGQDIGALPPARLDVFRGRHIGIVFQTLHLVSALNVADNLRLARYLAGLPQDDVRLGRVMASLGLAGRESARPRELSQGEAQRVAIARAVINEPRLILADEPTSALDDRNCVQVLDLLQEQAAACRATLVIATHDARIRDRFSEGISLGASA